MKSIFLITGEPSGDTHASEYVKKHLELNKNIRFSAIGQRYLKNEKVNLILNSEEISVVGIVEVLYKYRMINKALKIAKKYLKDEKPDLVILVDYVEFNLKIAKYAKSLDIPVIFYIAPQVWAWRENRIKKIIKTVDHLAVVFPFESEIFKKFTDNVTYVGHPLADNQSIMGLNVSYEERKYDVGIFPGSRESEIKNNIYVMLDAIKTNAKSENSYEKIRIFYASESAKEVIKKMIPDKFHNLLIDGNNKDEIRQCRKAITASGTITLELALMMIPMVIVYKLSSITYFIMKKLVKLKFIGLVNLILGRSLGDSPIVKEYIQPSYHDIIEIMVELQKIDNDESYRLEMMEKYQKIREILKPGAAKNLANIAESYIK
tara:strand:- start:234 stop:1361 length:1128 start_codon:yes stop_codon:yes gene_type:complete